MNEQQKQISTTQESYSAPGYERFQFETSGLIQKSYVSSALPTGNSIGLTEGQSSGTNFFRDNDDN